MEQFFRGDPFAQKRKAPVRNNTTAELNHNYIVLEITNNWDEVKDLYKRIEEDKVNMLDPMESTWVQFLSRININDFEGPIDFEKRMLKPLNKNNH